MKRPGVFLLQFILPCIWLSNCNGVGIANNAPAEKMVLIASTPGDPLIKSLLGIDADLLVDFIRWDLRLSDSTFILNANYGEVQPNTKGFKGGGKRLSLKGTYKANRAHDAVINGEVFELKPDNRTIPISFVQLNDNIFQLLTPDNKLMIGNGGWSYTLNRSAPPSVSPNLVPLTRAQLFEKDTTRQVIFDGRTPCFDPGRPDLQVGSECIKLKWKIILNRDPVSHAPTTYVINSTMNRATIVEGKWALERSKINGEALLIRLDPDKPEQSMFLLVGDKNVLFFLDKEQRLMAGNEDFSFTLNRKQP